MKVGAGMNRHPRTLTEAQAKVDVTLAVYAVAEKHKLTDIELMRCLTEAMSGVLKYALRVERHGDAEYPADWPPATRRRRGKIVHHNGDPLECRRANLGVRS